MRKVAYTLTNKKHNLQAGQRVALVYPNTEPIPFSCAFYGCLLAGLVPVVVEVPMHSEVSLADVMFCEGRKCSFYMAKYQLKLEVFSLEQIKTIKILWNKCLIVPYWRN